MAERNSDARASSGDVYSNESVHSSSPCSSARTTDCNPAANQLRDADARDRPITRRLTGSTWCRQFSSVQFVCCEHGLTLRNAFDSGKCDAVEPA